MRKSNSRISSDELSALAEANRKAYWAAIDPDLAIFRQTPEEQAIRAAEEAAEAEEIRTGVSPLGIWAERIARDCREGLRFQRWCESRGVFHSPYEIRVRSSAEKKN